MITEYKQYCQGCKTPLEEGTRQTNVCNNVFLFLCEKCKEEFDKIPKEMCVECQKQERGKEFCSPFCFDCNLKISFEYYKYMSFVRVMEDTKKKYYSSVFTLQGDKYMFDFDEWKEGYRFTEEDVQEELKEFFWEKFRLHYNIFETDIVINYSDDIMDSLYFTYTEEICDLIRINGISSSYRLLLEKYKNQFEELKQTFIEENNIE